MSWFRLVCINSFAFGLILSGCTDSDAPAQPGYTSCGSLPGGDPVTCQPNQYCDDEVLHICEIGCLSDDNCTDDQDCDKETGADIGVCAGGGGPDPANQLARCQSACSKMVSCGLIDVGEGSECQSGCQSSSDDVRRSVADCLEPWSCNQAVPGCTMLECGPSYDCPGDDDCVDHTCL